MMRIAALAALRDLRGRMRDRSAWIAAFVAPLALAAILSLAFGADSDGPGLHLAVAEAGGDAAAEALARTLAAMAAPEGGLRVATLPDEPAVRAMVGEEDADAGIVVRPGAAGPQFVVLGRHDAPVSAEIAQSIAQGAALGATASGRLPLAEERLRGRSPTSADYYGPAMAVFFVFFVTAFAPLSLIAERRDGTFARLAAAPIRMAAVLLGKGMAVFTLGLVSVLVVWGVTFAVFGAHWGHPLGVLALVVAVVLAAGGLTALAAAGARTERQADGQISLVVFTGALLGGNFVPLTALPGFLRDASLATPNGWAMRGFVELSNGASARDVLPNVGVLVAMAALAALAAAWRAERAWGAAA
jgi:ABC-2 type transport system permease protein